MTRYSFDALVNMSDEELANLTVAELEQALADVRKVVSQRINDREIAEAHLEFAESDLEVAEALEDEIVMLLVDLDPLTE